MTCQQTGVTCKFDFRVRTGWSTRADDENRVTATISDKDGKECYRIDGQYTKELTGTDLRTGQTKVLFTAPEKPKNTDKMFGMNIFALQLNYLPESLKLKLPPTDCRLRGDLRGWDQANLDFATREKNRLEENQRARRAKVKTMLNDDVNAPSDWNISDERTFYNPQYFTKKVTTDFQGKKKYQYEPKKAVNSG